MSSFTAKCSISSLYSYHVLFEHLSVDPQTVKTIRIHYNDIIRLLSNKDQKLSCYFILRNYFFSSYRELTLSFLISLLGCRTLLSKTHNFDFKIPNDDEFVTFREKKCQSLIALHLARCSKIRSDSLCFQKLHLIGSLCISDFCFQPQ